MLRTLSFAVLVSAILLTGCVSRQAYNKKVSSLTGELLTQREASDSLTERLQALGATNEALSTELLQAQDMVAEMEQDLTRTKVQMEQLRMKFEAMGGGVVESVLGDLEATADKAGVVQVTIPFSLGGVELTAEAQKAIESLAKVLADKAGVVFVEGHSDNLPVQSPQTRRRFGDNLGLSLARAAAVARVLIDNAIPADRIVVAGAGSTRPVADNDTPEGRGRNRRVEVRLVPVAPKPELEPEAEFEAELEAELEEELDAEVEVEIVEPVEFEELPPAEGTTDSPE